MVDTIPFNQSVSAIKLCGESLVAVYEGSKIVIMSINVQRGEEIFRRNEVRLKHNFNLFRPTTLALLGNEILVQDEAKQTLVFDVSTERAPISKYRGDHQFLVAFSDVILGLTQNRIDHCEVSRLKAVGVEEIIEKVLQSDPYKAC